MGMVDPREMESKMASLNFPRHFYRLCVEVISLIKNLDRYGKPTLSRIEFSKSRALEIERLRDFLRFAYKYSEYWNEKFDAHGLNPLVDDPRHILENLPVLTKREVIQNKKRILPNCFFRFILNARKAKTGGSTGEGLSFYTSRDFRRSQWLTWLRGWSENGVPIHENKIWLGGKSIFPSWYDRFWVYSKISKTLYLNIYKLKSNNEAELLRLIEKYQIRWVHGYPSTVTEFVCLYPLISDRIEFATVSSETLMENQSSIMKSHGIKVVNHYGMSEGVINISHVNGEWVSDDDFAVLQRPGKNGVSPAIGTSYTNKAFPLINYSVDDTLVFDEKRVLDILGRQDDYVTLLSGKKLHRLDHLFKGLEAIIKAQLVQFERGQVTCILRIASSSPSAISSVEESIKERLNNMVTESFEIDFDYNRDFIVSKNGKVKMVVNNIK